MFRLIPICLAIARCAVLVALVSHTLAPRARAAEPLKAFYGAEGFGSLATGGRGGDVYTVTNLNASGPGSLRFGIEQARSGPRTIVFGVSGTIDYDFDRLRLRGAQGSNLTIAGQTAPGDGILIRSGAFEVSDAQNLVVRHLRVRWGSASGDNERDAISVGNTQNAIFDHISASWGGDENFSLTGNVDRITIQNSLIAEGIKAGHQYGSLINPTTPGGGRITLYGNLYTDLLGRAPRAASQNGQSMLLEMVNNVVYNWGTGGDRGTQATSSAQEVANWNMANNYHIAGPYSFSPLGAPHEKIVHGGFGVDNFYLSGNKIDSDRDGILDGVLATNANVSGTYNAMSEPFAVPDWARISNLLTADEALQRVIADVGAFSWNRDVADFRYIAELKSYGTLGVHRTDVPGWPVLAFATGPLDSDGDGMPDAWEQWYGTNPLVANNNAVNNPSGYTDLEQYLEWILHPDVIHPIPEPGTLTLVVAALAAGAVVRLRRLCGRNF